MIPAIPSQPLLLVSLKLAVKTRYTGLSAMFLIITVVQLWLIAESAPSLLDVNLKLTLYISLQLHEELGDIMSILLRHKQNFALFYYLFV